MDKLGPSTFTLRKQQLLCVSSTSPVVLKHGLTNPYPPYQGVCFPVLFACFTVGEHLLEAYRAYLEEQFQDSSDLTEVNLFSVPLTVDPESPTLLEWCNLG